MSFNKHIPLRKAASSFLDDETDANLIQLSPHKSPGNFERDAIQPTISNHGPRCNFIGDLIPTTEKSRAFAVSKTGEKYLLDLDELAAEISGSHPSTITNPKSSAPAMENILEKSSSELSLPEGSHTNKIKLSKKAKAVLRLHKYPLACTPRNGNPTSSIKLFTTDIRNEHGNANIAKGKDIEHSHSIDTQTEDNSFLTTSPYQCVPRQFNKFATTTFDHNIPMEGLKGNCQELFSKSPYASRLPSVKPLKVYTKRNTDWRNHCVLRSTCSAVTLIIVVSWLFLTFFDVECLGNYFDWLCQHFQNWFLKKERPKTKVEIIAAFLQELWS